jgi:signal peptidase I
VASSRFRRCLGAASALLVALSWLTGCGAGGTIGGDASAARSLTRHGDTEYRVPGDSMLPTLPVGAKVDATRVTPAVGDVVVVSLPQEADRGMCSGIPYVPRGAACKGTAAGVGSLITVKRVAAAPGDEIYIKAGKAYRRAHGAATFEEEQEPYASSCHAAGCELPKPIKVPAGTWFILADARANVTDSRAYGVVPQRRILGVVTRVASTPAWFQHFYPRYNPCLHLPCN